MIVYTFNSLFKKKKVQKSGLQRDPPLSGLESTFLYFFFNPSHRVMKKRRHRTAVTKTVMDKYDIQCFLVYAINR